MSDTLKLLRECDAGIKMGVSSIDEVLPKAQSERMREKLTEFRNEHDSILVQTQNSLSKFGDSGKEPNPMAKGMSWIKTNVKLTADTSDKTIADLMTDGCNMGIKSLNRYLNQYATADSNSKHIASQLIDLEKRMTEEMKNYL